MPHRYNEIVEQLYEFFFKIFVPAFSGLSIKLATMVRKEKITPLRAILSYIVGILMSYLLYPMIFKYSAQDFVPFFIATIAMSGEKISEFLIYKWNVDALLTAIANVLKDIILKFLGK